MKITKAGEFGGFTYHRNSFYSEQLQKEIFFGVLKPIEAQTIDGSLYFIHGGNGDDEQFMNEGLFSTLSQSVIDLLKKKNIQIIFPGIGLSFLKEDQVKPQESYSCYFFDELIPVAERGTRTTAGSRMITGVSMGGHASLNAFMRKPQAFCGAGAIFPGVVNFNPFDSKESQAYLERTKISDQSFQVLLDCFRSAFRDEAEFLRHDPLTLLKGTEWELLRAKAIYLDVGTADEFGLHEGTRALSDALFSKDIAHRFDAVEGGIHDMNYVKNRLATMFEYLLGKNN